MTGAVTDGILEAERGALGASLSGYPLACRRGSSSAQGCSTPGSWWTPARSGRRVSRRSCPSGGGAARMSVARRATADVARRRGNPAKLPGTTMAHREEPQWWAGLGAGTHWVEGPVVAPAQE